MFRLFTTKEFEKDFARLDKTEQLRIRKIIKQLEEKAADVGKPLSGLPFFREKYFDGKRLYFLVYEEFSVVLVIAMSNKKAQQATINEILNSLVSYKENILKRLEE